MKKILLFLLIPFIISYSQVNISVGSTVSENFNSLGTVAVATMPTDWKVDKNTSIRTVGTYSGAVSNTELRAGTSMGSSAQNGIYNFGLGDGTTATDRAVGGISSGSGSKSVNVYAYLKNSGTSTIKRVDISYDVYRFRNGTNTAGFTIQLYYSTDGTTWTSAGSSFTSSFTGGNSDNLGGTTVPMETKNVLNQRISSLTIAAGGSLYLAWNYSVTSGSTTSSAQALGIDNFVMNNISDQEGETIPDAPVALSASSVTDNSFTANWNSSSGGSGYYLDVATDNSFSSFLSGYNNLSIGNSTTYAVTGLTQKTTYYYRVRAYNSAGYSSNSNTISVTTDSTITKVQFTANAASVAKSAGAYNLTLSISNPSSANPTYCTISYYADSSSSGGAAYVSNFSSQSLTFPAGSGESQNLTVTLLNDGVSERSRKVYFTISSVTGGMNAASTTGNISYFCLTVMSGIDYSYYTGINTSLTGSDLKTALYNLIKGHIQYPYTDNSTDLWDILSDTDEDPSNPRNVIGIYSGFSIYKYPSATSSGTTYNWNKEHVWAKSHGNFGTDKGAGTDAHHLRAENNSVNTLKSNLDFDNGGTLVPNTTDCYYDSDSWEPRDEVKGDIARMIFYMATRYQAGTSTSEPLLTVVDSVNTMASCSDAIGYYGKLSTLLTWNAQDPVDAYEINRNNNVYYYQHNRNPYIDHPEFITAIWGGPVGITDENVKYVDVDYRLNQNYPNPFNPSTSISFYVPVQSRISLSIYNAIGQKVETLYEGELSAGSHRLNWNASRYSSGIYFYVVNAVSINGNKEYNAAKKMILMK